MPQIAWRSDLYHGSAAGCVARTILASEWLAAALGVSLLLLHLFWLSRSEHQSDVSSGLGGALAALGIYIATQPYIRKGLTETAREQAGLDQPGERHKQANARQDEAEGEGVRHLVKERVVGVLFIAVGSVLNGYGPAIGHWLALRGS